jgi:hypothetical protein
METVNELQKPSYETFKLTRQYGISKSNFDYLPKDVIKNITSHISQSVAIQLKHKLLYAKYKNDLLTIEDMHNEQKFKLFYLHNGVGDLVPDIAEYATWESNTLRDKILMKHVTKNRDAYGYHRAISYDDAWLVSDARHRDRASFFNVASQKYAHESYPLYSPITAIAAAHHSHLFAICNTDGNIQIITPTDDLFTITIPATEKAPSIHFSPDDTKLLMYTPYTVYVSQLTKTMAAINTNGDLPNVYKHKSFSSHIKKARFSPCSQRVVIALETGELIWWDIPTNQFLKKREPDFWRASEYITDKQSPFMLWSEKNDLFFSLDPADNNGIPKNFIIREATSRKFIAYCHFFPNTPKAMGLTKDENNVMFVSATGNAYQLQLYNDQELAYIRCIEQEANLYQLCFLWNMCAQNAKTNPISAATMLSYISSFSSTETPRNDTYKQQRTFKKIKEAVKNLFQ